MPDPTLEEACKCLGVTPEDGPTRVERAYQRLKALYAGEALATYALFDAGERQAWLDRIEDAYRRITEERRLRGGRVGEPDRKTSEEGQGRPAPVVSLYPLRRPEFPPAEPAVDVDPRESPGQFLKISRERAGIPLREVASRLKVSVMQLEQIEAERFDQLPAVVFLQGFLGQYAAAIGLRDPGEIKRLYLEKFREAGKGS